MPKRKIHFIGFLANVDDSILKLKLKKGFEIKKLSQQEVMPFLRTIDFHYGVNSTRGILNFALDGMCSGCYCVSKSAVTEFESTPQGGVVIQWGKGGELHRTIQDKLRLLRFFKEGNIALQFSCIYHLKNSQPSVLDLCREWPIADKTKFHLNDSEVLEAQSFMEDVTIPFKYQFLKLAFESFELSYEVHNIGLAFLSLMISMETLFNRSDRELRYRISRNTAVLLGENHKKSEKIFKDVRNLYDRRSEVVHGVTSKKKPKNISEEELLRLRNYVRESIKEIERTDKNKLDLLEILNSCGFGQRPWREPE